MLEASPRHTSVLKSPNLSRLRCRFPLERLVGAVAKRVDCLDGLRGLAALWVLVGHCLLLTNWHLPVASEPDLGVDLFILLSGFLMVFHYRLRAAREPWDSRATWIAFWTRRF